MVVALGVTLAAAAPSISAQPTADTLLTVAHYLDLEQVGNPQISPDGKTVVYTRGWVDKVNDRWENAIWIMNSDGTKNRFLVKGGGPVWSPDGSRIAYTAMADEPKGTQIFVRWMDAEGATTQVTRVTEAPGTLKWSPDGKSIAFAMLVPKTDEWSIDLPPAPPNAKWTGAPRVVTRMHYRFDRNGYLKSGFNHLFLVTADGGTPKQLTRGDWSVGATNEGAPFGVGYDFSPDGKTLYFDGNDDVSGADLAYRVSNIYALDLATLATKRLTAEKGRWSRPTVSPDGSKIAYAGFAAVKQTYKVADLWVMSPDGGGARDLTANYDRDASFGISWAADGSGIYLNPEDKGSINIQFVPLAGGTPRPITTGAQVLRMSSMAKTGTIVGTRTTPGMPAEVVRVTESPKQAAQVTQLTNVNDDLIGGKRLASFEEIWYPSTGGARIQGWIVKPPSFDPKKKYPLLLEIHGGPHGMYSVGFDYMWQTWAANGYLVLYTNPRGSTGYGTAFGNAIDQAYPSVDYDDLMAGVDTVIGRGYVDEKQMFVAGCSGGGVLSSWVIGHTTRFAGAAVRCPVIDWISMMGQTDIPLFGYNFFGKPFWESPDQWLKQSSIMYVGNVTTPTLLMTGELDLRTPIPQSEEFYSALKMRGVPTTMLRFQGEWHGTQSLPSNWMRTQLYMMSWFKKYGGKPTS
jgi:dipeptidyl aminopeptidase/acylaminoacyl peptidase